MHHTRPSHHTRYHQQTTTATQITPDTTRHQHTTTGLNRSAYFQHVTTYPVWHGVAPDAKRIKPQIKLTHHRPCNLHFILKVLVTKYCKCDHISTDIISAASAVRTCMLIRSTLCTWEPQFMQCKEQTQMIAEPWLTLFGLLISTGLELVVVVCILTMARRQN